MNGGWPLSRQKLAAKSSDVTPIPGIASLFHGSAFFDRPRRVTAPPVAAPKSAPTAPRTVRVAQSSWAAESSPTSAPMTTKPMKMSFRMIVTSSSQTLPQTRLNSLVQIEVRHGNKWFPGSPRSGRYVRPLKTAQQSSSPRVSSSTPSLQSPSLWRRSRPHAAQPCAPPLPSRARARESQVRSPDVHPSEWQ